MSAVDERREGCDGCDRSVTLDELTAVTLADGETVACCPRCEPHARRVAEKITSLEQRRARCDGCTDRFLEGELADAVMPDGVVVTCCPSCLEDVPGRDDDQDGSNADASDSDESDTDEAAEKSLCMQCREWVSEEPFEVTTIDGRTERLCSTCKRYAEEDGIVDSVEMRKSRAREILGVEPGATAAELKRAYREQVKRAHPDRKSGSKSAFSLVTEAYDRLRR